MGGTARTFRRTVYAIAVAASLAGSVAQAQFSDSYKFLKAVRERDGALVTKMADEPGSTMVNTRDPDTGDTPLHIVVKRRDGTWLQFLLAKGAKPDARDRQGNTPLAVAAQIGFAEGARILLTQQASVDLANNRGETPLILAVQARDLNTTKMLLALGANPRVADHVAGLSARDYAERDNRNGPILKAIDDAKPVKAKAVISGPKQ